MNGIGTDCEAGSADILLREVRQQFLKLAPPLAVFKRDLRTCGSSLPDSEKPHPVEAIPGQSIQFSIWDVVQYGRPFQCEGKVGQRNSGVDLIQGWISRDLSKVMIAGSSFEVRKITTGKTDQKKKDLTRLNRIYRLR